MTNARPRKMARRFVLLISALVFVPFSIGFAIFAEDAYSSKQLDKIGEEASEHEVEDVLWLFSNSEGTLTDFPREFLKSVSSEVEDVERVVRYGLVISSFHAAYDSQGILLFGYSD